MPSSCFLGFGMISRSVICLMVTLALQSCVVLPTVNEVTHHDEVPLKFSVDIRPVVHVARGTASSAIESAVRAVLARIASRGSSDEGVAVVNVHYQGGASPAQLPSLTTDESYEIEWTPAWVNVTVRSVSGAVYALETLSQLSFRSGGLPSSSGRIRDAPKYPHRGLLVDTGRRFWPLNLMKQTIEAMAASKLNVLHLHFTDNCRFAIESVSHPELVPSDGQFLTQAQVRDLIAFAAQLGVRILPEIDLPGHARGMRNARGVTWSDATTKVQMTDSSGTRAFLRDILREFASLFPDQYFHIGADETEGTPSALVTFAVETLRAAGKKVVGWEEAYFVTGAGTPETLTVQLWKHGNLHESDTLGFASIFSPYTHLYLDLRPRVEDMWIDIAAGGAGARSRLLGGEVAMWTDAYCPKSECYNDLKPVPAAGHLHAASADEAFTASMHRMMWPRSVVAASAFWNFVGPAPADKMPFMKSYLDANFGIKGCVDTPTCRCSELEGCDEAESVVPLRAPLPAGRGGLGETSRAPVSVSIYPTRFGSWGVPEGSLVRHYAGTAWPQGDVFAYYVDSFYSGYAFAGTAGIESFLLQYRTGNEASTVWFVFDDSGKNDPVLLRHFIQSFVKFTQRLTSAGLRDRVGKIGVMVNVEAMRVADIELVIAEEYNRHRNAMTRLAIAVATDTPHLFDMALRVADLVPVHMAGIDTPTLTLNIGAFLDEHAAIIERIPAAATVTFIVKPTIGEAATRIAQEVHSSIPTRFRERLFRPRGFLTVYGWERWVGISNLNDIVITLGLH